MQLLGFRGVWVFDISQTGGEALPDSRQSIDVADKLEKLTSFAQAQGMSIEYTDWIGPNKGNSYRGKIRLLPNMEPGEAFPVLLREVASQLLYTIKRRTFVARAVHQQETKAAAFVVCEALGFEAKAGFSDCQLYYGDSRLFGESLEVVHRAAAVILGGSQPRYLPHYGLLRGIPESCFVLRVSFPEVRIKSRYGRRTARNDGSF
ncbi:MAG TPA: hypothetical protein VGK24_05695, partial [Candidatus Angelobacter sp.]